MTASSSSISTFELSREYERLPPTSRSLTRPTHFSPISREVKTRMDAAAATCSFSSPKVPIRRLCACVRVCTLCIAAHAQIVHTTACVSYYMYFIFFFPFLIFPRVASKRYDDGEQGTRRKEGGKTFLFRLQHLTTFLLLLLLLSFFGQTLIIFFISRHRRKSKGTERGITNSQRHNKHAAFTRLSDCLPPTPSTSTSPPCVSEWEKEREKEHSLLLILLFFLLGFLVLYSHPSSCA